MAQYYLKSYSLSQDINSYGGGTFIGSGIFDISLNITAVGDNPDDLIGHIQRVLDQLNQEQNNTNIIKNSKNITDSKNTINNQKESKKIKNNLDLIEIK